MTNLLDSPAFRLASTENPLTITMPVLCDWPKRSLSGHPSILLCGCLVVSSHLSPSSSLSEETIMDIIASLMVLPNRMCVPLIDQVKVDQMRFPLPRVCQICLFASSSYHLHLLALLNTVTTHVLGKKSPSKIKAPMIWMHFLYVGEDLVLVDIVSLTPALLVCSSGRGEGPPAGGQRPGG